MVKQLLLAANADAHSRRLGIKHVDAWRLKGKVPLAVDATSSLLDAMDDDAASHAATLIPSISPSSPPQSEYGIRLKYALPIIKLVNGVSDSQQRGRVASSVAVLASVAGLPRVLVDIRHDASHKELPSLQLLRLGARQALEWLEQSYWSCQLNHLMATRLKIGNALGSLVASCTQAAAASKQSNSSSYQEEEEEDEEEEEEDVMQVHMGAEGKRYRKGLTSSLRSHVPISWCQYIVDSILDPCSFESDIDQEGDLDEDRPLLPPGPGQESSVEEREGFYAAMKLLSKSYPSIGSLVVSTATRLIIETGSSSRPPFSSTWPSVGTGSKDRVVRLTRWLIYALNHLTGDDRAGRENTVIHLLLEPLIGSSSNHSSRAREETMEACSTALISIRKVMEDRQDSSDALLTAVVDSALTRWKTRPGKDPDPSPSNRTRVQEEQKGQDLIGNKGKGQGQGQDLIGNKGKGQDQLLTRRWQWADEESWHPCPIGRMPDVLGDNGRPCTLNNACQTNRNAPDREAPALVTMVPKTSSFLVNEPKGPQPMPKQQGFDEATGYVNQGEIEETKQRPAVGLKKRKAQLLL